MRSRRRLAGVPTLGRNFLNLLLLIPFLFPVLSYAAAPSKPNIIFILADDLGYGEIGCYGQKTIETPRIDQMAREGMRFTQFYAGATVCAPSRSVLMTGQHQGHTRVRGNAGRANPLAQSLRSNDVTIAGVLRDAGYKTALIGKWGLGDFGGAEQGLPRRQGFDYFFGFLSQLHAHNHYPSFLWRNEEKVSLPNDLIPTGDEGAGYATNGTVYADALFTDEAVKFIDENRSRPFFLYLSLVVPHSNNERNKALKDGAEVPDYGPYANKPWPTPTKGHAAMITHMDSYVGRILDHLRKQKLEERTLVIFTSDNGPHSESSQNTNIFNPSGPLRGFKRDLTDGGIRVPFVAWWPGTIKPRRNSDHVGYFGDFMATAAELAGVATPSNTDSISFVPELTGRSRAQRRHEFLYFEFHEKGFTQGAILDGRWKGIRSGTNGPLEVYDLKRDIGEKNEISAKQPKISERLVGYLNGARSQSPDWEVKPPGTNASPTRPGGRAAAQRPRVLLTTSLGDIEIDLNWRAAPVTVSNFLHYIDAGFYSGGSFHRTVTLTNQPTNSVRIEVVQASADQRRTNEFLPPIQLERTRDTGLKHRSGTVSMARAEPDSAQDHFFICIGDQPELDFGGKRNPDGQGFAAFGRVTKGMDIVRRIHASPADGQKLVPPIQILRATRLN